MMQCSADRYIKSSISSFVGVTAAVVVGIGFAGLAVCLLIICCGVVCLHRSVFRPCCLVNILLIYLSKLMFHIVTFHGIILFIA